MFEKIYVVTDLGPGDGGKGSIIHALCCIQHNKVNLIVKRGGAQGSHGVSTYSGEKFNFSQWGCGTFEGIPTFLSKQMVISPVGLSNEAEALRRLGFYNPFTLLMCDPSCVCATPLHRIASEFDEILLKDNPRGTIGSGVGQAYRMSKMLEGEAMTIRAFELTDREILRTKLKKQLDYYKEKYAKISPNDVLAVDVDCVSENLSRLYDNDYLSYCLDLLEDVGKKLVFKDLEELMRGDGAAIVESSHGVLTDAETGFRPHVSAIRTLPKFATEMLREAGYSGEIVDYAVHRAYGIRHGAGPMPTYDPDWTEQALPDSRRKENRWQGIVRAGALDLNLLRYALEASSETKFDGLCLTCFDQILAHDRKWRLCVAYENALRDDECYVDFLKRARPIVIERIIKKPIHRLELFQLVEEVLQEFVKIPLKMLSIGPTERDKIDVN